MRTTLFEGEIECPYCQSTTYEVIDLDGRIAKVQCLLCLSDIRTVMVKNHGQEAPEKTEERFRFASGRHSGQTLDEVAETPKGKRYLNYLRSNANSLHIRETVEAFFSDNPELESTR